MPHETHWEDEGIRWVFGGIVTDDDLLRWMIFRYLSVYKRVTLEETGQVGPLYHACSIASFLAGVFAVAGILTKVL